MVFIKIITYYKSVSGHNVPFDHNSPSFWKTHTLFIKYKKGTTKESKTTKL